MKRSALLGILTVVVFWSLAAGWQVWAAGSKTEDEKAAVVNGVVISKQEIDRELERYKELMQGAGQTVAPEQVAELSSRILDNYIDRELLVQASAKEGVQVTPEEVDGVVMQMRARYPSEKEFTDMLSQLGVDEKEFKHQLSRELAIRKYVRDKITPTIAVSEQDIKKYYDDNKELFQVQEVVHAFHILIQAESGADAATKQAAREKLAAARERIKKGEEFSKVAKEVSEDPSSENGGDLGFIERGRTVKPFEDAAFALEVDEVSDIVETQFGYHLIKVTEKKPAGVIDFKEAKDNILPVLRQEKVGAKVKEVLEKMRQEGKIEIFLK